MLRVRLAATHGAAEEVGRALQEADGVRRVVRAPAADGRAVLEADLRLDAADHVVATLKRLRIPSEDYVLSQLDVIAPAPATRAQLGRADAFAWVEVLGQARRQARPLARYLVLMMVAGIVAGLGVIKGSSILIVGAMAISPDLLPLCSLCVGLVGRRRQLAMRAFVTLVVGLALVGAAAAAMTLTLNAVEFLPDPVDLGAGGLDSLATTDYSTVLIALAAGIAAMLAFETRASAAVGVAISVTTIPASAYWGVALGAGQARGAGGALIVLGVNVCLLALSGSVTLAIQRELAERAEPGEGAEV